MSTKITQSFWKSFRFWCTSYYCRRYADKFAHARKLFVLDIMLVLSACVTLYVGLTWFFLTPTTSVLDISFATSPNRIISGDDVSFDITLHNQSNDTLDAAALFLSLPEQYLVERIAVQEQPFPTSSLAQLVYTDPIGPNESIRLRLDGRFYGSIGVGLPLSVTAQFTNATQRTDGIAFGRLLTTARESVLHATLEAPEQIIVGTATTIGVTLENTGDALLQDTSFLLESSAELAFEPPPAVALTPGETQTFDIPVRISNAAEQETVSFVLTPTIALDGTIYTQVPVSFTTALLQPELRIASTWDARHARVDETHDLTLTLRNAGKQPLTLSSILLSAAQATELGVRPSGQVSQQGGDYRIPITAAPTLAPGATKTLVLPFSIRESATRDRIIRLLLRVQARVGSTSLTLPFTSSPLSVASELSLQKDVRFYTREGDQIGRGALPLTVGKETSLWATITVRNTTSRAEQLLVQTTLPQDVSWTGNASLSHGTQPVQSGKTLTWRLSNLPAFETAIMHVELSLTPSTDKKGLIPVFLEGISLSARDAHTGLPLEASLPSLRLDETLDERLRTIGTKIQ